VRLGLVSLGESVRPRHIANQDFLFPVGGYRQRRSHGFKPDKRGVHSFRPSQTHLERSCGFLPFPVCGFRFTGCHGDPVTRRSIIEEKFRAVRLAGGHSSYQQAFTGQRGHRPRELGCACALDAWLSPTLCQRQMTTIKIAATDLVYDTALRGGFQRNSEQIGW
jgi:hypothetical protein